MSAQTRSLIRPFGAVLKRYRIAATLSQEALAERAGISVRGLSDLERGLSRAPRLDTLHRLAEALGLEGADRQALASAAGFPPVDGVEGRTATDLTAASSATAHPALPGYLTRLLGRQSEIDVVSYLLRRDEVRLLTLTGPGGVGKTRLAVQVASELRSDYADGVIFVGLAPVRCAAVVPAAIAQAVCASESGDATPFESVVRVLRSRRVLLVLDNFEHVLDAAPLVSDLLRRCPTTDVLLTSRSPLRLMGEQLFPVQPLVVPSDLEVNGPQSALEFASVALFVERAQAVKPDFMLTDDNLEPILAISRRLDGLPLALELAAARITVLPPAALLQRLRERVNILSFGPRDAPERHRALADAIAWSHDLLLPEHQRLFRRLSVFAGGWTLSTVERVCHQPGSDTSVLDGLTALVDHSLVQVPTDANGEPRFGLLETIRAHALDRLEASGEATSVRKRHAEAFVELAEQAEWHLISSARATWLAWLDLELDNFRAALAWTLSDDGDPELGQRLVGSLSWFWYLRGRLHEGRGWAERLAARAPHTSLESRSRVLFSIGGMTLMQGDLQTSRQALELAVPLVRELHDRARLAQALIFLAMAVDSLGSPELAVDMYQEAMDLTAGNEHRWLRAFALTNQGAASMRMGDLDSANQFYCASLSLFRELDDPWGCSIALRGMAGLRFDQHEHAAARELYEQSVPLFRMTGDTRGLAQTLLGLGRSALGDNAPQYAREVFAEALTRWKEVDIAAGVVRSIVGLASVAMAMSEPERAATLYAAADAHAAELGVPLSPADATFRARNLSSIRRHLGQSRFEVAWTAGRELSLDESIDAALASATR